MRLVVKPSPNFNARRHPLDMLVLHFTGMEDGPSAEARLADPLAEVSAHYVVREDGVVVQMVSEDKRAWHAGVSRWQGDEDLNSRSIGIEIVNGGHDFPDAKGRLPAYPKAQIAAVISLCRSILSRHDIPATRIVGHSDIAPARKADPGEHFPWLQLATAGIGLWPLREPASRPKSLSGRGLGAGDRSDSVRRLQEHLASIGYDLPATGSYDAQTEAVVTAFQRRWQPDQVTGQASIGCIAMVGTVSALYLEAGASRT
ncbi:MAG: N-acetylmuramoyl-L-alanine amidase [Hyphomonadaceae bacterium]|nr:N-acetylmuramoyl-L-alanine amidase [Hyphomonadaceae bacterium]